MGRWRRAHLWRFERRSWRVLACTARSLNTRPLPCSTRMTIRVLSRRRRSRRNTAGSAVNPRSSLDPVRRPGPSNSATSRSSTAPHDNTPALRHTLLSVPLTHPDPGFETLQKTGQIVCCQIRLYHLLPTHLVMVAFRCTALGPYLVPTSHYSGVPRRNRMGFRLRNGQLWYLG
jgi:hypothetical protein